MKTIFGSLKYCFLSLLLVTDLFGNVEPSPIFQISVEENVRWKGTNIAEWIGEHTECDNIDLKNAHFSVDKDMRPFRIRDRRLEMDVPIDREVWCYRPGITCPHDDSIYYKCGRADKKLDLRVIVIDQNDEKPSFTYAKRLLSISEDGPIGSMISLPIASDKDVGVNGSVKYSVAQWQNSDPHSNEIPFTLVDNDDDKNIAPKLKVIRKLDRETTSLYKFTLLAIDKGHKPNTGSIILSISIVDVNDNVPKFEVDQINDQIDENRTWNKTIKVTDIDDGKNGQLNFHIKADRRTDPDSLSTQYFEIIRLQEGIMVSLRARHKLDYEKVNKFRFFVVATDNGEPPRQASATISLTINNQNDERPAIEFRLKGRNLAPYRRVLIAENTEIDTTLVNVHVSDPDGTIASVSCSAKSNRGEYFQLTTFSPSSRSPDKRDYRLSLIKQLDRELFENYPVKIFCVDKVDSRNSLTSTAMITIQAKDINDSPPVFTQAKYFGRIAEGKGDRQRVKVVQPIKAKDADAGRNGKVVYKFIDGHDRTFAINGNDGFVYQNGDLDYETRNTYVYTVVAFDQGSPALSSSAELRINISDVNDGFPKMKQRNYVFQVFEEIAGAYVGQVEATDEDSSKENHDIIYSFNDCGYGKECHNAKQHFRINSKTGNITTRSRIDREKISSFFFEVVARNRAPPVGKSFGENVAAVTVTILDVNDHQPTLRRGAHINSIIFEISDENGDRCTPFVAEFDDPDEGINGQVELQVVDNEYVKMERREGARLLCLIKVPPMSKIGVKILAKDKAVNGSRHSTHRFMIQIRKQLNTGGDLSSRNDHDDLDTGRTSYSSGMITAVAVTAAIILICCIGLLMLLFCRRRNIFFHKHGKNGANDRSKNLRSDVSMTDTKSLNQTHARGAAVQTRLLEHHQLQQRMMAAGGGGRGTHHLYHPEYDDGRAGDEQAQAFLSPKYAAAAAASNNSLLLDTHRLLAMASPSQHPHSMLSGAALDGEYCRATAGGGAMAADAYQVIEAGDGSGVSPTLAAERDSAGRLLLPLSQPAAAAGTQLPHSKSSYYADMLGGGGGGGTYQTPRHHTASLSRAAKHSPRPQQYKGGGFTESSFV